MILHPQKLFLPRLWLLLAIFCSSTAACSEQGSRNKVCFQRECVTVEIADTDQKRERGLQNRQFLGRREGMLFIFAQNGRYSFWMKDTLIPLDMIWLDDSRRVVYVAANVPPCRSEPCPVYTPPYEARYVLELNAGMAQKLGLHPGSQVQFWLNKVQ